MRPFDPRRVDKTQDPTLQAGCFPRAWTCENLNYPAITFNEACAVLTLNALEPPRLLRNVLHAICMFARGDDLAVNPAPGRAHCSLRAAIRGYEAAVGLHTRYDLANPYPSLWPSYAAKPGTFRSSSIVSVRREASMSTCSGGGLFLATALPRMRLKEHVTRNI